MPDHKEQDDRGGKLQIGRSLANARGDRDKPVGWKHPCALIVKPRNPRYKTASALAVGGFIQVLRIIPRIMPMFFLLGVIFTTILALFPSPLIPGVLQFWDKAQHTLAYTVLTVTGVLSFPKNARLVCLGLLFHGALIEIMQVTLATSRTGDVLDWFADGIGVLTAIGACASIASVSSRRQKKDGF